MLVAQTMKAVAGPGSAQETLTSLNRDLARQCIAQRKSAQGRALTPL